MAYTAVARASGVIASNVCKTVNNTGNIAILSSDTKSQIIGYRNTMLVLKSLKTEFETATANETLGLSSELAHKADLYAITAEEGDSKAAPIFAEPGIAKEVLDSVTGALGSFKEFFGMFETRIKERGFKPAAVTRDQLVPEVADRIRATCNSVVLYNPNDMPFSLNSVGSSELMTILHQLYKLRYKAEIITKRYRGARFAHDECKKEIDKSKQTLAKAKAELEAQKTALAKAKNRKEKDDLSNKVAEAQKAYDEIDSNIKALEKERDEYAKSLTDLSETNSYLQALIKQFDGYIATLLTVKEGTPTPLLTSLFEAEKMVAVIGSSGSYTLELQSNAAGSTRRVKRNMFLDLFFPTGRITYNGVATIRYSLYKEDSVLKEGCTVKTFLNFRRIKHVNEKKPALVVNECGK